MSKWIKTRFELKVCVQQINVSDNRVMLIILHLVEIRGSRYLKVEFRQLHLENLYRRGYRWGFIVEM